MAPLTRNKFILGPEMQLKPFTSGQYPYTINCRWPERCSDKIFGSFFSSPRGRGIRQIKPRARNWHVTEQATADWSIWDQRECVFFLYYRTSHSRVDAVLTNETVKSSKSPRFLLSYKYVGNWREVTTANKEQLLCVIRFWFETMQENNLQIIPAIKLKQYVVFVFFVMTAEIHKNKHLDFHKAKSP